MQFSKNVIHLINAKTTGGIEIGAKQAEKLLKKKINYKVKFLYNHSDNLFSKFKKIFYEVFKIKRKIDKGNEIILISSLWASHLLCFFLKLLNNKFIWVSFIHNSNYPTLINKLICTKLTKLSDDLIFDSISTAQKYHKNKKKDNKRVVNFYFRNKLPKFSIQNWNKRKYDFVIVGRNIRQKGFFLLENFINSVLAKAKSKPKILIVTNNKFAEFDIVSMKKRLKNNCNIDIKLNLENKKVLKYLTKSKIYFCLSIFEGFGITIVEALLCGCYIYTTNVGEQKNYLWSERRKIIKETNNFINFHKISKIASSKNNYKKSIKILNKRVNVYTDQLEKIIKSL